jgi:hypothetical protein
MMTMVSLGLSLLTLMPSQTFPKVEQIEAILSREGFFLFMFFFFFFFFFFLYVFFRPSRVKIDEELFIPRP